jgi:hypothetical protein
LREAGNGPSQKNQEFGKVESRKQNPLRSKLANVERMLQQNQPIKGKHVSRRKEQQENTAEKRHEKEKRVHSQHEDNDNENDITRSKMENRHNGQQENERDKREKEW